MERRGEEGPGSYSTEAGVWRGSMPWNVPEAHLTSSALVPEALPIVRIMFGWQKKTRGIVGPSQILNPSK